MTAMTNDRMGMMNPLMMGMNMGGMMPAGMSMSSMPAMGSMGMNGMMVPRCTMKMEKCTGGMKIYLHLRRQNGRRHDAEPLHDDGRRHVGMLHDDERHDGLLLQPDDGHVQVRNDRRWAA